MQMVDPVQLARAKKVYAMAAPEDLMRLYRLDHYMSQMIHAGWGRYLEMYIVQLSKNDRKALSRDGALECREGEETHYTDHRGVRYRDPMNSVYARALRFLLLEHVATSALHDLNDESMGDVFEGLLGVCWRKECQGDRTWHEVRKAVQYMVREVEALGHRFQYIDGLCSREWVDAVSDTGVLYARDLHAV